MKPSLLEFLVCPACGGALALASTTAEAGEVIEGTLSCGGCRAVFPVRRGVPRFVAGGEDDAVARTAEVFGWEWKAFSAIDAHHEEQFLDWIAPVRREDFRGQVVVEGGCGKGRHTRLVASWGARAIIGVDLSEAVDVAWANTRALPNAHIIQADLRSLPVKPRSCDRAFSIGVLHHMPDPQDGFRSLAKAVRPGGVLSVWVYGAENNAWVTMIVSPLRSSITSRLPHRMLWGFSAVVSVPLYVALKTLYRPAQRPGFSWLKRILPYEPYLSYISPFPFREVHHIVHDHLAAPVAHYLRKDQVERWYRETGAAGAVVSWHNRNSWRGYGIIPGGGAA